MKVSCSVCQGAISGRKVSRTKSRRSTARRFSELCGTCLRIALIESIRVKDGFKRLDEVDAPYRTYVERLQGTA